MDIYTKIFLANIVAVLFTAIIDKELLGDAMEHHWILGPILGIWCIVSIVSIPVFIIWLILTF